jgi:cyanate lyase
MPLGDIATTYLNLLVSNPAIHWLFTYQKNDQVFELDDAEIKETIGDVPLTDPEILRVIRELFETNINEVMHQN